MRTSEYDQTLYYLFGLRTFGIHLGLDVPRSLAKEIGEPQKNYPAIHIAGTNGKGSTSALIEAVLREKGLKTGLYTSPHLVNFNERIRVNGVPIDDESIIKYAEVLKDSVAESGASFFEVTTLIALKYFADMEVDIVIAEAGLGARLDTTMLVEPIISVLTSIGLDHTKYLGETVEEIAGEKAFVIRKGVPCIVAKNSDKVLDVFTEYSIEIEGEFTKSSQICEISNVVASEQGLTFDALLNGKPIDNMHVPLMGLHQIDNIQTSLAVLDSIPDMDFTSDLIKGGFESVEFRGRMEVLSGLPLVIYDVAHNPQATEALFISIEAHYPERKIIAVIALLKDKNSDEVIKTIGTYTQQLVCTEIPGNDSVSSAELAKIGKKLGIESSSIPDISLAVDEAKRKLDDDSLLIIFGSHYFAENVYDKFGMSHPFSDSLKINSLT